MLLHYWNTGVDSTGKCDMFVFPQCASCVSSQFLNFTWQTPSMQTSLLMGLLLHRVPSLTRPRGVAQLPRWHSNMQGSEKRGYLVKYIFISVKTTFYSDLKYMLPSVENDLLLLADFLLSIPLFSITLSDSLNWHLIYSSHKLLLHSQLEAAEIIYDKNHK